MSRRTPRGRPRGRPRCATFRNGLWKSDSGGRRRHRSAPCLWPSPITRPAISATARGSRPSPARFFGRSRASNSANAPRRPCAAEAPGSIRSPSLGRRPGCETGRSGISDRRRPKWWPPQIQVANSISRRDLIAGRARLVPHPAWCTPSCCLPRRTPLRIWSLRAGLMYRKMFLWNNKRIESDCV